MEINYESYVSLIDNIKNRKNKIAKELSYEDFIILMQNENRQAVKDAKASNVKVMSTRGSI